MGLDMYLTKKIYVGLNFEHNIKKDKKTQIITNGKEYDYKELTGLSFKAAYWRKANAIHNWFVNNVQGGEDDCKEYYVDREQLADLVNSCKKDLEYFNSLEYEVVEREYPLNNEKYFYKIFKEIDESKLSLIPTSGFFFGSTEYDSYYIQDLENTVEQIEKVLRESKEENCDFYYQSSW